MLVSLVTGVIVGEGISRLSNHESSPRFIKKVTQASCETLKSQYCVSLVGAAFFASALCRAVVPKAQSILMNRKGLVTKCLQTSLSLVGLCTFSSTFVLATVMYIARRNAALTFFEGLKKLYSALKELEAFISESLSDPSQVVEKLTTEITKELQEINEVAQAVMFHNEPEAIKGIDQEISSFEEHLKEFEDKMPDFVSKIDMLLKKIQENQSSLSAELSKFEEQAKKLEELVRQIDEQSNGFCQKMIKDYIDYDKLKLRMNAFQELFEVGIALRKKALLISTGLDLIRETNSLEAKGINLWFSIVECTPLPMVQDMGLTALSLPILIKELGRAYMYNQFRSDSFLNFKVKRVVLCKKYPEDVAEFRDGLVELRNGRSSIFKHLNEISASKPLLKEDWKVETASISVGSRLLTKSSTSLRVKLMEERSQRSLIKIFII